MKKSLKIFTVACVLSGLFVSNSFAAQTTVGQGATVNSSSGFASNDTILFTGSTTGIFNVNSASVNIGSVSTNNNGVGTLQIGQNTNQNGIAGSSDKRINGVTVANGVRYYLLNDIYTINGITNFSGVGSGGLTISNKNLSAYASVGTSLNKLSSIQFVNDITGYRANIYGDVYINQITFNSGATLYIDGQSELGDIRLDAAPKSALILNGNSTGSRILSTADTNGTYNGSKLQIAAGKSLTLSGTSASDINGFLDLGITYGASASIQAADTVSLNTGTLNSVLRINFDYANSTNLNTGEHTFLSAATLDTTSPSSSGNTCMASGSTCNYSLTDTSILLTPTVKRQAETLVLSNALDNTVVAQLGTYETANMYDLLDDTNLAALRTEMLKISDVDTLKKSMDTLEDERNNMIQNTSLDVSEKIHDIINYRTMALNYNYVGFSSGDKKPQKGSLWGQVFGSTVTQDQRLGEEGYKSTVGGVVFGGDGIIRSSDTDIALGLALSYADASAKGDSLANQTTDIKSYQATIYNYVVGSNGLGLFSENNLTVGYNEYDSSRRVKVNTIDTTAKSNYEGLQFVGQTTLGYNFRFLNRLLVSPNASLKYGYLTLSDYTESGAGNYGLVVANKPFKTPSTNIGVRIMGELDLGKSNYRVYPQLNLSWTRNISVKGREATTRLIGGSENVENKAIDLVRNIFNIGGQFDIDSGDYSSLVVKYDMQAAKAYLGHSASITYKIKF